MLTSRGVPASPVGATIPVSGQALAAADRWPARIERLLDAATASLPQPATLAGR